MKMHSFAVSFLGALLLASPSLALKQHRGLRDNIFALDVDQEDSSHNSIGDLAGEHETVVLYADSCSTDHAPQIQDALDRLNPNDTLVLRGDFVIEKTIYLPSNIQWNLEGTLSLGDNPTLDKLGGRPVGLTEVPGGATNIRMSGGTYNGMRVLKNVRLLNFVHVMYSAFRDMEILNATDDNFSLGYNASFNTVHNLISGYAGGNGLTDKGRFNKWYDSIAEHCDSDGWTPKSFKSEYHRCIARENNGPGFGLYARQDQSKDDLGAKLNGNIFYQIEAYCNARSGISMDVNDNCGPGAEITDNFISGVFWKNVMSGVQFRNRLADAKIINNAMDVVAFGNYGYSKSGTLLGGISVEVSGQAVRGSDIAADRLTRYFLGHGNNPDVNIQQATDSTVTVYKTEPEPEVYGNVDWMESAIVCPPASDETEWRVKKYCELLTQPLECETVW